MTETLAIPGRPEALVLEHRAGRVFWSVGDCRGDELTAGAALAVAERYLGVRVVREVRAAPRLSVRQVGPSSRKPGAGPNIGVAYVSATAGAQFARKWEAQGPLCHHGQAQKRCEACDGWMHVCPGSAPHSCFQEP